MDETPLPSGPKTSPKLSVGTVMNHTYTTLMKNPFLFFGLTLMTILPAAVLQAIQGPEPDAAGIVILILVNSVVMVFEGAIAYGVFQILRGNVPTIEESLSRGLKHLAPIIFTSLLAGIGIGLGTLLFIVPGLILMCVWAVAIPASAVEGTGATVSLKRSADLTEGNRWVIFGLFVLLFLVGFAFQMGAGFLVGLVGGAGTIARLSAILIGAIPVTFQNVMESTLYYDLRSLKEGVSIDSLAKVFD